MIRSNELVSDGILLFNSRIGRYCKEEWLMLSFSQRMGYTSIKSLIQVDSIDQDLKNALWNVLHQQIWSKVQTGSYGFLSSQSDIYQLNLLWEQYFKEPLHKMPRKWDLLFKNLENYYFHAEWYEVYDFIEFNVNTYSSLEVRDINNVLTRELSAYRFVDKKLVKITADEELEEIEQAIKIQSSTHFASKHLKEALKLFAAKQNPDYRNSIKESISAVEAICTAITKVTGNETSTLGTALKEIEKKGHIELHPALKQGFDKLYGYTSDGGIRHFLKSDKEVNFEDAKFMLVSCSAFVNYLTEKAGKAEIKL
jgi:hypothetical protein